MSRDLDKTLIKPRQPDPTPKSSLDSEAAGVLGAALVLWLYYGFKAGVLLVNWLVAASMLLGLFFGTACLILFCIWITSLFCSSAKVYSSQEKEIARWWLSPPGTQKPEGLHLRPASEMFLGSY